jgi:hypothetical protein
MVTMSWLSAHTAFKARPAGALGGGGATPAFATPAAAAAAKRIDRGPFIVLLLFYVLFARARFSGDRGVSLSPKSLLSLTW